METMKITAENVFEVFRGHAARLYKKYDKTPSPMPEDEIANIKIAKDRGNRSFAPCPKDIAEILRFDRFFNPDLKAGADYSFTHDNTFQSLTIKEILNETMWACDDLEGLNEADEDLDAPAIIGFFNQGDEWPLIYVTELNEIGCYPMFRYDYDDMPEFYRSERCVMEYLICWIADGLGMDAGLLDFSQLNGQIGESARVDELLGRDNAFIMECF